MVLVNGNAATDLSDLSDRSSLLIIEFSTHVVDTWSVRSFGSVVCTLGHFTNLNHTNHCHTGLLTSQEYNVAKTGLALNGPWTRFLEATISDVISFSSS